MQQTWSPPPQSENEPDPNWAPPDPNWAPPPRASRVASRRRGRRLLTTAALIVVVALTAVSSLMAAAPPSGPAGGNATALIGTDGHVEVQTDGNEVVQIEWAHLSGPRAFSGPFEMYYVMESTSVEEAMVTDWLRVTRTNVLGEQTHRIYSIDEDGLRLRVDTEDPLLHYFPGRLELPADVADGTEWVSDGQVSGTATGAYRTEGRASAADDVGEGCLGVELSESINGAEPTTTAMVWCPERGVVHDGDWGPGSLDPAPRGGSELDWHPETWQMRNPVPASGPGDIALTTTPVTAPLGPNGHSIAIGTSQDVAGFDQNWSLNGVSHAGGQITAATQVGDLTLTANSNRTITATDPRHWRRWQIDTTDVANQLVPVGTDRFIAADSSGAVSLQAADTGDVLWETSFPGAGEWPITVDGDHVYLASSTEEATILDLATGDTVATVSVPDALSGIGGGRDTLVVYGTSGRVWAHDTNGTTRWEAGIVDNPGGGVIAVTEREVIIGGDNGVYGLDRMTGQRLWFSPEPAAQVVTDGHTLVVYSDSHLAVLRDGVQLHHWERPSPLLVSDHFCRALTDGVTCIDGNGVIVEARP